MMADAFVIHDLYMPTKKMLIRSAIEPLTCYVCKRELNGVSITARAISGRTVFLCSAHLDSDLQELLYKD